MRTHLVFGALLGAALALAGAWATEARGDFVLYGSESLTVDTSHTTGYLWDTSRMRDVAGGDVDYLYAYYSSTVDISDGSVTFLHAFSTSTADISGGSVDQLDSFGSSIVDITGGSLSILQAYDTSTVTFYGRDFNLGGGLSLEGDRVLGTGRLTGEWMDGTPWTADIKWNEPGAHVLVVPEPATLTLMALGGLAAFVARRRRG